MSSLDLVLFQIINNSSNLVETRVQSLILSVYMWKRRSKTISQVGGKSIILSGAYKDGQIVKQITQNNFVELNHLFSSQEEADTGVILHAAEFCNVASRIIIRADDTDVLVLLLFYSAKGRLAPEVYMHAGHARKIITRERFIPVHTIAAKLGERFCLCLQPYIHSRAVTPPVQYTKSGRVQPTRRYRKTKKS